MALENTEKLPPSTVFPLAYGIEEETGMQDNMNGYMDEPYLLASDLGHFTSSIVEAKECKGALYLINGSKLYVGRAISPGLGANYQTNIERASPECASLKQLVLYNRASEMLVKMMASRYIAEASSYSGSDLRVRIQRRVVDSNDSRKGLHDNFGIAEGSRLDSVGSSDGLPGPLLAHLASRSIISGAGYVVPDGSGLQYAQKIDGLTQVNGYGYYGSVYRITSDEGTKRCEIRCGDINISDWAVMARVGGTAIALALNQTPLGEAITGIPADYFIAQAKSMNRLEVTPEGTIIASKSVRRAVDIQQHQAELFITRISQYSDAVPDELYAVASEIYAFCEDFKLVYSGDETIALLADRADWAAKFKEIFRVMHKHREQGIPRSVYDIRSCATDMRYDSIILTAEDGILLPARHGKGYRLRDAGAFRGYRPDNHQVEGALSQPPANTRAALRAELIRNYPVIDCDWHRVSVQDEGGAAVFAMPNILETEFSPEDQQRLSTIKRCR